MKKNNAIEVIRSPKFYHELLQTVSTIVLTYQILVFDQILKFEYNKSYVIKKSGGPLLEE